MVSMGAEKFNCEMRKKDLCVVLHPKHEHLCSLIWLHDLGDTGAGYFKNVFHDSQLINVPDHCRVIMPTAPVRGALGGVPQTSWYTCANNAVPHALNEDLMGKIYNQEDIKQSCQIITKLIETELAQLNGDTRKVFLGGHSQGGSIALATYLQFQGGVLGGVVATSSSWTA